MFLPQKMLKTIHQQKNTTIHEDRTPAETLAEKTIGNEGSSHYTCSCSDSENDSARNSGNDLDFEAVKNHSPTDNTTTNKDCTSDESTVFLLKIRRKINLNFLAEIVGG